MSVGSQLDSLISVPFPGWGRSRRRARAAFCSGSKGKVDVRDAMRRAFDAAKEGRLTADWITGQTSADRELSNMTRQSMINRSRDAYQNNPLAKRAVDALVSNVIRKGIRQKPNVRPDEGQPPPALRNAPRITKRIADDFNRHAAAMYPEFCRTLDAGGRLDKGQMEAMALRSMIVDGEGLAHRLSVPGVSTFSTKYELIETDRLATPRNLIFDKSVDIRDGIELGKRGEPTHYWIAKRHPGDFFSMNENDFTRVPAADMLHIYQPLRPGQTHGMPWLHAVLMTIHNRAKYMSYEMVAAVIASAFAGFITTDDDGMDGEVITDAVEHEGEEEGKDKLAQFEINPGTMTELDPGQDVKSVSPNRPSDTFEPFLKAADRDIAGGTGLSYATLTGDLREATYSSVRTELVGERAITHRPIQHFMSQKLSRITWADYTDELVLRGFAEAPGYLLRRAAYQSVAHLFAGWPWIQPKQEIDALVAGNRAGLITKREIFGDRQLDSEEQTAIIAAENDADIALGIGGLQQNQGVGNNGKKSRGIQEPGGNGSGSFRPDFDYRTRGVR